MWKKFVRAIEIAAMLATVLSFLLTLVIWRDGFDSVTGGARYVTHSCIQSTEGPNPLRAFGSGLSPSLRGGRGPVLPGRNIQLRRGLDDVYSGRGRAGDAVQRPKQVRRMVPLLGS